MSSSLTFQLREQKDKLSVPINLPSPPNSSCGDEAKDTHERQPTTGTSLKDESLLASLRRDSLPTHFSALTLQHFSTSLPENYTIDHSSPIPIHSLRRPSHSPRPESPLLGPVSTATAAGTGGRTIRHRRPSEVARKSRVLSESPKTNNQNHRCEECGKVYKHPNCLSKHRWEHSEEWELTSKLLLTKHQQVQMLEAAAILVSMDAKRQSEEDQVEGDGHDQEGGGDDISIDMDQDDDRLSIASDVSSPSIFHADD
ncbi:hypothetical protein DFQ28_007104 [Apophysomyces sp. BC1034]|nr:hypothetical protein DFQ30_008829 [Apophysomyces sp. BC1015]KAG0175994.1 hypothetical protein DFQ29_006700 [Apophysomyces sp. BC1021]KAG0192918.1 hypothetical protein DFQ28_007104 [Apophysomyces sp. BC1034]